MSDRFCLIATEICQPIGWWDASAAWAQAILSALAIFAGAWLATRQQRAELARRLWVYVDLIDIAAQRSRSIAILPAEPSNAAERGEQLRDFEQFVAALHAINLQDMPDYRLLPHVRNATRACERIIDDLRVIDSARGHEFVLVEADVRKRISESRDKLWAASAHAIGVADQLEIQSSMRQWAKRQIVYLRAWFYQLRGRVSLYRLKRRLRKSGPRAHDP